MCSARISSLVRQFKIWNPVNPKFVLLSKPSSIKAVFCEILYLCEGLSPKRSCCCNLRGSNFHRLSRQTWLDTEAFVALSYEPGSNRWLLLKYNTYFIIPCTPFRASIYHSIKADTASTELRHPLDLFVRPRYILYIIQSLMPSNGWQNHI